MSSLTRWTNVFSTMVLIVVPTTTTALPIDKHLTAKARQLYQLLMNFTHDPNKIMFGQHGATQNGAYNGHAPYHLGVIHNGTRGWSFTTTQARTHSPDDLCDMKSITGEYPAIMEFDIGKLVDLDNQQKLAYLIQRAVDRKQVVSVSWHAKTPISNTSVYVSDDHSGLDVKHSIQRVLPNGDKNLQFNESLDTVAAWIKGLKYSNGQQAAVIFRPFHEMNGGWFWWGTNKKTQNTPDDYKNLYKFVVHYLRDVQRVHNVLYAFSPSKPESRNEYLKYYPGDDYVDILGTDFYYKGSFQPSLHTFKSTIQVFTDLAAERHKIAAFTEVGITDNGLEGHLNFWMDHVLTPLKSGHGTSRIAYMLTWDNFCSTHNKCDIRVPYHGHPAEWSFLRFFRDPVTVFQSHMDNFVSQIIG